ncbi:uncharacterized [Tachysurus ichikawai]
MIDIPSFTPPTKPHYTLLTYTSVCLHSHLLPVFTPPNPLSMPCETTIQHIPLHHQGSSLICPYVSVLVPTRQAGLQSLQLKRSFCASQHGTY